MDSPAFGACSREQAAERSISVVMSSRAVVRECEAMWGAYLIRRVAQDGGLVAFSFVTKVTTRPNCHSSDGVFCQEIETPSL